jgi:hypothetical protein
MVGDTVWYRAAVGSWFDLALDTGSQDGDDTSVVDAQAASQPVWWRSV